MALIDKRYFAELLLESNNNEIHFAEFQLGSVPTRLGTLCHVCLLAFMSEIACALIHCAFFQVPPPPCRSVIRQGGRGKAGRPTGTW